jgi:hypothetical protein
MPLLPVAPKQGPPRFLSQPVLVVASRILPRSSIMMPAPPRPTYRPAPPPALRPACAPVRTFLGNRGLLRLQAWASGSCRRRLRSPLSRCMGALPGQRRPIRSRLESVFRTRILSESPSETRTAIPAQRTSLLSVPAYRDAAQPPLATSSMRGSSRSA